MNPIACTPTLSSTISYLTSRSDVATSMIQFCLLNPGRISDHYDGSLISFRTIASAHGDNKDQICQVLKGMFHRALSAYFPDDVIHTNFVAEDYDESNPDDPRYRVVFDIYFGLTDGSLQPGALSGHFIAGDDSEITVSFR